MPDVNDHAPVLLCDGRRIYHFSNQALRGWNDASLIMRTSDNNGKTWTKPKIILPRHAPNHLSQPCSACIDKNGVIVLAVDGDNHSRERIMISRDKGDTWKVSSGDMKNK